MAKSSADLFRVHVRAVMKEQGWTVKELAKEVGTSQSGLSRILLGQDGVTLERADRIAKKLGFTTSELTSENFLQPA